MEKLKEINVNNSVDVNMFKLDKYIIVFKPFLKYEVFKNEWNYGIIFYTDMAKYELIHSQIGNRLLINKKGQDWNLGEEWNDVPLNEGTFHFLPEGVTIKDDEKLLKNILLGNWI